MTLSSHKIYGPKGIAALYVRQETPLEPLIYGGGQEFGLRSSTEAVPLIVGFAKAFELAENLKNKVPLYQENLKNYFIKRLKIEIPNIKINGPQDSRALPNIINITFFGFEGEQIVLYLDKYGIRASLGAACDVKKMEPSHVLSALGLKQKDIQSSVRFSLGRNTTKKDLDYVVKTLKKITEKLKKIYPPNKKYYYD